MSRWGRIIRPAEEAGQFLLVEPEEREPRYPPPPAGSVRVWHRCPGVDDDDDDNWSVWLTSDLLPDWFGPEGRYEVEWLAQGIAPDWSSAAP